jgi:ferredoxin
MSKKSDSFVITIKQHESVPCLAGKTLLESLEQQNIALHYHCREGFCGACRSKIISGQVEYLTDPLAFIDDDEILPCCCKALSDIEIELGE